jgi:hypothetical protein
MYVQYFDHIGENHEDDCIVVPPLAQEGIDAWNEFKHLGVGRFARMSTQELGHVLGWPQLRPPIFAELRSCAGRNDWREGGQLKQGDPDVEPMELLWHQLCGVAAIVDKIWTENEEHNVPGILLADAVGLGKTVQIMATIAVLIQVWMAERQGLNGKQEIRPQLIGETTDASPPYHC